MKSGSPKIRVYTLLINLIIKYLTHLKQYMKERKYLRLPALCMLLVSSWAISCQTASSQQEKANVTYIDSTLLQPDKHGKVRLTDDQWKKILSPQAFAILRKKQTEFPYTGDLLKNKKTGTYVCGGCGLPLFSSATKFESGTGWPSFFKGINPKNITEIKDNTHGMSRTEVVCSRCDGHLGHVFDDGPAPTGLRYCMNSVALKFVEKR